MHLSQNAKQMHTYIHYIHTKDYIVRAYAIFWQTRNNMDILCLLKNFSAYEFGKTTESGEQLLPCPNIRVPVHGTAIGEWSALPWSFVNASIRFTMDASSCLAYAANTDQQHNTLRCCIGSRSPSQCHQHSNRLSTANWASFEPHFKFADQGLWRLN